MIIDHCSLPIAHSSTHMKKPILLVFFCILSNFLFSQIHLRFEVKQLSSKHTLDTVYVAGNFNNWVPDYKGGRFSMGNDGSVYLDVSLPKGKYEYKLTRGSWSKVETKLSGFDISNRELNLLNDTMISLQVGGWKDDFPSGISARQHTASANVIILDSVFYMPELNRTRRIWAYLPADYKMSKKKYPVLYMHDGQALFDAATSSFGEWGVDECLDTLFKKGGKECIVIGIDNSPVKRLTEYNPYEFRKYGKGEGNAYVDFLVKTLKPYIDSHLRTMKDKKNTFVAGSSMGGLISMVAVMRYPDVFGGAGIFSPAFWTAPQLTADLEKSAKKMDDRLFFYAGGSESEEMVSDMQKIENILHSSSHAKLYEIIDPIQKHNEAAWRKYFPDFIQWILNF